MAYWPSFTQTRFKYLGLTKADTNLWRFVCLDWESGGTSKFSPAAIGPYYKSKGEALADLNRYAEEYGYTPDGSEPYVAPPISFDGSEVFRAADALAYLWGRGETLLVLKQLNALDGIAGPVLGAACQKLPAEEASLLVNTFVGFLRKARPPTRAAVQAMRDLIRENCGLVAA